MWTLEKLKAKTPGERHTIYQHACARQDGAALALRALIEESGLPVSNDGGLKHDDPVAVRIAEIAFSRAGSSAMKGAVGQGLPPMAGLDPLLRDALGKRYDGTNQSTVFAGRIAAERMEMLGFKKTGRKAALPAGCVAKTAEVMV